MAAALDRVVGVGLAGMLRARRGGKASRQASQASAEEGAPAEAGSIEGHAGAGAAAGLHRHAHQRAAPTLGV